MSQHLKEASLPLSRDEPFDIFADTIAEMTWYQVENAARDGAILLWAFGVIEQHGPHMPTGTDVYIPSMHLRNVRAALGKRGIQALIVPPYYWGVNVVSGSFPASYRVRPEIMVEMMADVFASLAGDGFKQVFCVTGHGDHRHNQTIYNGIKTGVDRTSLDISFLLEPALALRLGLKLDDPLLTIQRAIGVRFPSPNASTEDTNSPDGRYIDVHAGCDETSMMLCTCPGLLHEEIRRTLKPTNLGLSDLEEWRKGFDNARRKTPQGYFGDPAAGTKAHGEALFAEAAQRAAGAIEARLSSALKPAVADDR
ncbi:creatininase family protein [Caballeronia sp. dw_19]|uniref:creatininase family protein n=1 Tax=Caballeronia sp. dw_19 TaxID=2719791 RepID=UPI001BD4E81D|nr:creatininase family protein [Caballeronia sp. dw_19]